MPSFRPPVAAPPTLPIRASLRSLPPLLLAGAAAVAGLGGCSTVPGSPGAGPEPAAVLRLEVAAPRELAVLLERHLDLARVNRLAAGEPLHEGELDRLIAATPQQARDLLDTEGYFNAETTVERLGGDPPGVRVRVEPGPRTTVGSVALQVQGPLEAAAAGGDGHARATRRAIDDDWPLAAGAPFRAEDWARAKLATVSGVRARGWVQADWLETEARIDAATQRAELSGRLESGPLFRIGPLRVGGLKRQDERTVRHIANLDPGAPATEARLLDIQERLQRSDLFTRTTVTLAPDPANPGNTPVVVELGERQFQEATIGIGVSANLGPRGTVSYVHRRPFDRPWIARTTLDLARLRQRIDGELGTQTLPRLWRNLVGGYLERAESDTDAVRTAQLRIGRAQDTRRIDRLVFAELQHSTTDSALGRTRADAVAVHYHGTWRELDDLLLPTRGNAWQGQVGVGHAVSTPGSQGPFVRTWARANWYRPVGRWYGQARVELGRVFARDDVVVPEGLGFRAGGDESVRGYAFRSLTTVVQGVEISGQAVFTASLEFARPLLERLPALWGAVFVDAGRAARRFSAIDPAVGYGVGVRYRSPIGPVKLDLAYGHEVRRARLHLSVGLSF